jgi:hypothetical protein
MDLYLVSYRDRIARQPRVRPRGTFRYETLTLSNPGREHGLVVQVPDDASRDRLARDEPR